jgi:SAM-dependent methyltransferase
VTRRPLSRQIAGGARAALQRCLNLFDRASDPSGAPVPPAQLRIHYYGSRDIAAFFRARDAVRAEVFGHGMKASDRVLEIGSGIGNLALALTGTLQGGYDGVEIHAPAVAWCQSRIASRFPGFRFHHADIFSSAYNPEGRLRASAYRFPFADAVFDFVFLGSVFTHMLPEDVEHYLREIGRVLRPGGTAVAGFFLINDARRAAVIEARSVVPFPFADASGRARLHDDRRPEAAIALEEHFVSTVYDTAGLQIRTIRCGDWWNGRAGDRDVNTARAV